METFPLTKSCDIKSFSIWISFQLFTLTFLVHQENLFLCIQHIVTVYLSISALTPLKISWAQCCCISNWHWGPGVEIDTILSQELHAINVPACEQQTYFRSSLLSLQKSHFSEGEKQKMETRLLFQAINAHVQSLKKKKNDNPTSPPRLRLTVLKFVFVTHLTT